MFGKQQNNNSNSTSKTKSNSDVVNTFPIKSTINAHSSKTDLENNNNNTRNDRNDISNNDVFHNDSNLNNGNKEVVEIFLSETVGYVQKILDEILFGEKPNDKTTTEQERTGSFQLNNFKHQSSQRTNRYCLSISALNL